VRRFLAFQALELHLICEAMSSRRLALLIDASGVSHFPCHATSLADIERLKEVLSSPEIGRFGVSTVANPDEERIKAGMREFFGGSQPDDVLLLYFVGYLLVTGNNRLWFALPTTDLSAVEKTSISAETPAPGVPPSKGGVDAPPPLPSQAAEIVCEYGPFPGGDNVSGVTYDGQQVWFATGDKLNAIDPASGKMLRSIDVPARAGTAFDGQHLYQIGEGRIQKIDPKTGRVLSTIPTPGAGCSGLAWAEGTLWVGLYEERKIQQVDPETGAILRTIECKRFVTGVTWVDGELWHGTWDDDGSDLRRIDPRTGEVLERLELPPGVGVSGLESDGGDQFFCGGGSSGKLRIVRRPRRASAASSDQLSRAASSVGVPDWTGRSCRLQPSS
jgi:outer membrane protein assembly factor BamB